MTDAAATDPAPAAATARAVPLPTAPYPGLRPFLDHEDMLMHGRQAQVADVVRRLGRLQRLAGDADSAGDAPPPLTRFVAVIGGSGSGKSSLIRAGVVPYLRQFGIPEAGDLWESVVTTPGTNFQPDADGVVHESPITRLAAKFERVLQGERSAQRCEAIAQMLRRDGGLGRMVDSFGPQLAMPPGVRPEDTCVLIVIDQFEELFHKTNAESADARALVERVIDHFHEAKQGQGSAKCFLAITMRSEHLNDCAGYLGLPEAINSGGYLVSRLGEAQLREVIERPAQRYLRLRQRERQALARQLSADALAALPPLPRTVVFEAGVVDRLVQAAGQIEHDPDHLPLLQHALARTWSAACQREGLHRSDVPAEVRLVDLWRAGQADPEPPEPPPAQANLLRLSLDSWAEHTLDSHTEADRHAVLDLMRRLAYKDLRTGSYNQQRLYVARHPLGMDALRALVRGRWIDDVDYLHWDEEDPQRVTLKVSHEAFIRGWGTLRALADREAARLDRFMALLEAVQGWVLHDRPDDELLDQRSIDRMAEAQLVDALGPPGPAHDADPDTATWEDWQRSLSQLPRGEPLKSVARLDARLFLRRSALRLEQAAQAARAQAEAAIQDREAAAKAQAEAEKAQAKAERAEAQVAAAQALAHAERVQTQAAADEARARAQRSRVRRRIGIAVLASAGLLSFFAFAVMVPVTVRSQHYFMAAGAANEVSPSLAQATVGGNLADLKKLLGAARHLERGSQPDAVKEPWTHQTAPLADAVLVWPGLRRLKLASLLRSAAGAVEPVVNRQLRQVLAQSVWYAPQPDQTTAVAPDKPRDMVCGGLQGQLTPVGGRRIDEVSRRSIFVTDATPGSGGGAPAARQFFAAILTQSGPDQFSCALRSRLPLAVDPDKPLQALVFDAYLTQVVLSTARGPAHGPQPAGGSGCEAPILSLLQLRWDDYDAGGNAMPVGPLAVVTDDCAAAASLQAQAGDGIGVARTWPQPGGRGIGVQDRLWRMVADTAQRLVPTPNPDSELQALVTDPVCDEISQRLMADFDAQNPGTAAQDKPVLWAWAAPTAKAGAVPLHCGVMQRSALPRLDQYNLQVFRRPEAKDYDAGGGLADTTLVGSFDVGRFRRLDRTAQGVSERWLTGRTGSAWDGWLVRQVQEPGKPAVFQGLPVSTAALRRLGEALCLSHLTAVAAAGAPRPTQKDCYPDER